MVQPVKLRVFIEAGGRRTDHVVSLPGETPCVDAKDVAHRLLTRKLNTSSFKVTGVNLYPHWNDK